MTYSREQIEAAASAKHGRQPAMLRQTLKEIDALKARVTELEVTVQTGKRLLRDEMDRANRYASEAMKLRSTHEKSNHSLLELAKLHGSKT